MRDECTVGTENILPCELRTSRTTSEVGSQTSSEVGGIELRAKVGRTLSEVGSKFERSWAEV